MSSKAAFLEKRDSVMGFAHSVEEMVDDVGGAGETALKSISALVGGSDERVRQTEATTRQGEAGEEGVSRGEFEVRVEVWERAQVGK